MEGWRRQDPPAIPQLAIPVTVPNQMVESANTSKSSITKATADLALIAFYYLLRIGEYTRPRNPNNARPNTKRTIQFRVGDIGFFKNDKILPRSSPLEILLQADSCTFKITNQKNGRMGETIHNHALPTTTLCPVKAAARRVFHILQNNGTSTNCICDVFENNRWTHVTPTHMITNIRTTVRYLDLQNHGIDPDLVGVHSLRAGGAMAMKLQGFNDTTIMKQGRWTSLTFLQYIHNQIAHLSANISSKMSNELTFTNIAAIEPW